MEYHQWSETSATLWPRGEVKERGEKRTNTSVIKSIGKWTNFPPPSKTETKKHYQYLRIANHKDIFSPSFPFLSLTQKTCSIDLFSEMELKLHKLHTTWKANETCHNNTSMTYKSFTVTYASRNLNLELTLTDQFNLGSASTIKDLLEP